MQQFAIAAASVFGSTETLQICYICSFPGQKRVCSLRKSGALCFILMFLAWEVNNLSSHSFRFEYCWCFPALAGPVALSTPAQLVAPSVVVKGTLSVTLSELYFEVDEEDPSFKKIDPKVRDHWPWALRDDDKLPKTFNSSLDFLYLHWSAALLL